MYIPQFYYIKVRYKGGNEGLAMDQSVSAENTFCLHRILTGDLLYKSGDARKLVFGVSDQV